MSRAAQDVRRRRLLVELDNVARLETRLDGLERALDDANHAYDAALAVKNELTVEVGDVREEHRAAGDRLRTVRRAYLRELMAKLPDDIVRLIFKQLLPRRESGDIVMQQPGRFGYFAHDVSFSVLPFALAGVCKQWRDVALALPALWSFIHVVKTGPNQLERVMLLLERSKSVPLDLVIAPPANGAPEHLKAILRALHEHTWRFQHIQQIHRETEPDLLALVQRAAPHLRRFQNFVVPENASGDTPKLHFLQFSPHVEDIRVSSTRWIHVAKPPYVFPALVTFGWNQPCFGHAWNIILAARETLKAVVLAPWPGSFSDLPPSEPAFPVIMRSLECLHILTFLNWDYSTYLPMLKAPRLTTLTLPAPLPAVAMQPFVEAVSPTVTTLILLGDINPASLDTLSLLAKLEHLIFSLAGAAFRKKYKVTDAFFANLVAPPASANPSSPCIWPRLLSTISLSQIGSFEAGTGENFLQFVRSRTGRDLDVHPTLRRLTSVKLADTATPAWLRNEVRHMLE